MIKAEIKYLVDNIEDGQTLLNSVANNYICGSRKEGYYFNIKSNLIITYIYIRATQRVLKSLKYA